MLSELLGAVVTLAVCSVSLAAFAAIVGFWLYLAYCLLLTLWPEGDRSLAKIWNWVPTLARRIGGSAEAPDEERLGKDDSRKP